MKHSDYPYEQPIYPRQGPGLFAVVITSMITSAAITLVILYITQNWSLDSLDSVLKQTDETPKTQAVPSLIGIPTKSAGEILKVSGLRLVVSSEKPHKTIPAGHIAEQQPLPESELESGGKVEVIVSSGPKLVIVPDLIDKPLEEGKASLKEIGLEIGETKFEGEGTPGIIRQVRPTPGTEIEEGSAVSIVANPLGLMVPGVIGLRTMKAKKAIKDSGLTIGKIRWRYDENKPAHLVLEQDPAPKTVVAPNSPVNLVLNPE